MGKRDFDFIAFTWGRDLDGKRRFLGDLENSLVVSKHIGQETFARNNAESVFNPRENPQPPSDGRHINHQQGYLYEMMTSVCDFYDCPLKISQNDNIHSPSRQI